MLSTEKVLKIQLVLIMCFTMPNLIMDLFIPALHSITSLILYATFIYTFIYSLNNRHKYNKLYIYYIIYFLIYSGVIFIDLTLERKYPLSEMLGCPGSVSSFIYKTATILLFILQAPLYNKIKDYSFLVKWYIILNLPLVLFYINIIGVEEILYKQSTGDVDISTLTLAAAASRCLLMAFIFKKSLTRYETINNILLFIIFIATISVWGDLGKRGAILWFFITLIIYFILNSKNIKFTIIKIVIILGIVYLSLPIIITAIENYSPLLAEKIELTVFEGDTSGRMDEEGGYTIAIEQFHTSPLFGSYFRLVTSNPTFQGMYPHNIILEMLITFGIVGLLPFLFFLWKILNIIRRSLISNKRNCNSIKKIVGILFLNIFFSMMSTGTPLLMLSFWLSIAILLTNNKEEDNDEKLFSNNTTQKQS